MASRTVFTPQRWKQVEDLFLEASALEGAERAALLDRRCGTDFELRSHVERMLAGHAPQDTFLESPHSGGPRPGLALGTENLAGRKIGAFELVEPIATGGMGTVWLGIRDDDTARQRVALKLLNRGLITEERRRLFEKERSALAQLEHPYVTRLIDGGSTDDGMPYLVMEYVEGQPLDQYCDSRRLPIRDRLKLFRNVCEAVHYAHTNLVVHRDLKPGNILVTENGQPKLLDFGVSKLLDDASSELQAEMTITAVRAFTPRYASPEQVRGSVITTSSDIYSLGVLLYEILTGARPYRLEGTSEFERVREVCEGQPQLPSRVVRGRTNGTTIEASALRNVTPEVLGRRLRGDLDTIVMKAMHKDPTRRYASAEQLSDDIRRYLNGQPVLARHDTIPYRLSKFVLRNQAAVIATTIVLFSVVVAAAGMIWQGQIAAQQRDEALRAQRSAETLTTVFQETLFGNPARSGGDASQYMMLGSAIQRAEQQLAHMPDALARIRYAVGSSYLALRAFKPAQRHLRIALAKYEQMYGPDDPETARCLDDLGWCLVQLGDREGLGLLERAAAIRVATYGADQRTVADTNVRLAYGLARSEQAADWRRAETLLFEALPVYERRFEAPHATFAFRLLVLGLLQDAQGDLDEAQRYYRDARDQYFRAGMAFDRGYVMVLEHMADLHERRGQWGAARNARRLQQPLAHALFGDLMAHDSDWDFGRLEHRSGDAEQAVLRYGYALRRLSTGWIRNTPLGASELRQLDWSFAGEDDLGQLGRRCGIVIDILGRTLDYSPAQRSQWLIDLSSALLEARAPVPAEELARRALKLFENAPRRAATAELLIGLARQQLGLEADALRHLEASAQTEISNNVVLSEPTLRHAALMYQEMGLLEAADRLDERADGLPERQRRRRDQRAE